MLSGFQSSHISTAYMADEDDICNAELYYTELEADLQLDINMTEINYPDYDEYTYSVGEIRHNPYELMAYLSTAHNAFRFSSVKSEIEELFQAQYHLERTVVTHPGILPTHTLQTTLTVTPFTGLIAGKLAPGEQTDRYGVYMQTLGNRQAFGNPFDFPWLGYVSRAYGWQVDETGFGKVLNRGIDLAAAQGTPIRAVHDGRVVPSGDAGAMTIVIEDEKGYQSRYSPCGSVSVSVGQEVKRGDVIATVGGAATTAGPHLHLEVLLNGEYLVDDLFLFSFFRTS